MNKDILRRMIQTILTLALQGMILFVSAWSIRWVWAWAFVATGVIGLLINYIILPREVIEERGRKKENVEVK